MYRSYRLFKYGASAPEEAVVIAHRGASAYYPENTLPAFQGAWAMRADMVELDVQLTSDGEVVVFHDETLYRCTGRRGRVAGYSLDQIKTLDAGRWFSRDFAGETIPTLREVLSLCKNRMGVNIEIKAKAVTDDPAGGIEEKCLTLVHQIGMQDHAVFSSFDPRALLHLKEIDPSAATAVLFEKKHYGTSLPSQILESLRADAFNCSFRELTSEKLADLKAHSIPFHVYTVNHTRKMKRLLKIGAAGIFTNAPDILRQTLMDSRRV